MSDPFNLRLSGINPNVGLTPTEQGEKPQSRFDILAKGGDDGVGILGQMKSGAVEVREGEGRNAPDTGGVTRNRKEGLRDFLQGIGAGLRSLVDKAANALTRMVDQVRLRNVENVPFSDAGKVLAQALESGDTDQMKKAVKGIAQTFAHELTHNNGQNLSLSELVDRSFSLKGGDGHAILPSDVPGMRAMIPELRVTFANDPAALLVLDKMEAFDFKAQFTQVLDKELNVLRNIDDVEGRSAMGTFLRGNSFVTAAMKADQLRSFDPEAYGQQLVASKVNAMIDLVEGVKAHNSSLTQGDEPIQKLDQGLPDPFATTATGIARDILEQMVQVDGPGGLRERFGEDHLAMLKDAAEHIAAQDDILPEIRNRALFNLYNNDLFLRGVIPAMSLDPQSKALPMGGGSLVPAIIQSVLNDATGLKMSADLRDAFVPLRDEFQTRLTGAFIALGMPVVGID